MTVSPRRNDGEITAVLRVSAVFILCMAETLFAGTNTVVPTTTLAAETGNNTSASSTFTAQTNGNLGAGNVSKVSLRRWASRFPSGVSYPQTSRGTTL